jgi:hypothetical protein
MLKRSIKSALGICGEAAGRELPAAQMKVQAIATYSLSRTRLVRAIAILLVPFLLTFHCGLPQSDSGFEIKTISISNYS